MNQKMTLTKDNYKIAYVGLDIKSLFLISLDKRFTICCVNLMDGFLREETVNPINHIFKIIYRLRILKSYRIVELCLLIIWKLLKNFSNSIFYLYRDYLILISERRLQIINFTDTDTCSIFLKQNCDLCVVNNWWILPKDIIESPVFGCVNVHPSKLPQYAGSLPTLWSLKNNDANSAVSIIKLNANMDLGGIITQYEFKIYEKDDALSLEKKIEHITAEHLVGDIYKYLTNNIKVVEQDKSNRSLTGKYYPYMEIRWEEETARDICNKINLYPYLWPLDACYFVLGNRQIRIKHARILQKVINTQAKPGMYWFQGFNLLVKCQDGLLVIPLFQGIGVWNSLMLLFKARKVLTHG